MPPPPLHSLSQIVVHEGFPSVYQIPDLITNFSGREFFRNNYNVIIYIYIYIYGVSQEECARLRESVPYVKIYRYNPKHLCPK